MLTFKGEVEVDLIIENTKATIEYSQDSTSVCFTRENFNNN